MSVAGEVSLTTAITGTGDVTYNIAAGGTLNTDSASNFVGNTTVTGGGILNIATIGVVSGSITLDNGGLRFRDTRVITREVASGGAQVSPATAVGASRARGIGSRFRAPPPRLSEKMK